MHKTLTAIVVLCLSAALLPSPARAMSDAEKALWRNSADTPTAFTIPVSQGPAVMGKAKDLIVNWKTVEGSMVAMYISSASDTNIRTDDPQALGEVGFNVTCAPSGPVDLVTVETTYCTIHPLSAHNEEMNVRKRARALSYLLQQYAGTLPGAPIPSPAVAPSPAPALVRSAGPQDQLQSLVDILNSQIAAGQYDSALTTVDALKGALQAKQKASRN